MSDNDLKLLISSFVQQYGLVDHIIKSVNDAYLNGIPIIMKNQYEVNEIYKNGTIKGTSEYKLGDKDLDYVEFNLVCTDSYTEKPTSLKDGRPSPIYPNECIKDGTLYGGNLKASYKIRLNGYNKQGELIKSQESYIKDAIFGKMPIFLMSNLCNLEHLSKKELFEIGENPLEKGGYVRRGKTSTTFDMNERTNIYNKPNIYYVKGDNVDKSLKSLISRCNIISKPGIDYENSSECHVYYRDTGEITIKITNEAHLNEIPFYVLYRLWGVSSDIDILKYVILNNEVNQDDYFTIILIRALSSITTNYEDFQYDRDSSSILKKLSNFISTNSVKRKIYKEKILTLFDNQILPHLGNQQKHRHFKMIYIGILIRKCFMTAKDRKLATDRDSLSEKYIATAGNLMADQFKTLYNKQFIQIVKNKVSKILSTAPFESVDVESDVRSAITNSPMCGKISASINSDTGIGPGIKRKFTTQNLPPEGELSELNKKNVIRINVEPKSKNHKIRMTHATYTGGIDQAASPEGSEVGLNKTKTVVSLISPKGDYNMIGVLKEDPDVLDLVEELPISRMTNKATVSVNGKLIGFCDNIIRLREKYVQARRDGKISMYTGIHINTIFDEIDFRSDDGRILSIYIMVYNNIKNPEMFKNKYSKGKNFEQKTLFTTDIAKKVRENKLSLDDLRKMKIIEFLDIKELTHSVLCARSMKHLEEVKNDPLNQFTHVIIQAAMYGILCITQPMADHNPETRTNFQSKLSKQTTTVPVYNKNPFLNMWVQAKNDIPITKTVVDDFLPPGGRNIMLAVLSLAHNQEDSLIGNKGTFDRGNYLIDYYDIISCQVESGEKVENIYKDLTINVKSGDTSKLVDGVITKGSRIFPGDIILSKYSEIPKSAGSNKKFIDRSMIYSGSYPANVIDIIPPSKNEEGSIFKIKIQYERAPRSGDKFCIPPNYQVLTTKGWKKIKDVTVDDKVATLKDEDLEYHKPTEIHKFKHNGTMYKVKTSEFELKVTPNHKMYVKKYSDFSDEGDYELINAYELVSKPWIYKNSFNNKKARIDKSVTNGTFTYEEADLMTRVLFDLGHTARLNKCGDKFEIEIDGYFDCDTMVAGDEEIYTKQYCGDVYCLTVPNHIFLVRKSAFHFPVWTGNSSRQGQKGILAKIYPNHLMPFTKDGITPDFIFNPQGLPKRCTIGQSLEGLVSILNAHMGIITDNTPFTDLDVYHIIDCLKKRNYNVDKQVMYSGFESLRMDAEIVLVPCRYGRINKSVYDKHRSVHNASKDIETRQPKKGKKRGGGIKMGEMEGQGQAVSGPSTAIKEYYTKNSDGMVLYGCRCGSAITIVNEKNNIYECRECNEPSIVKTYSSFTSNMTRNIMEGMRVHTTYSYD